jgi:hypothetical protein
MAPVRCEHVVASFGVKVVDNVFPSEDVREWPELPLLDERLGDVLRRGLSGVHEASGIIASVRRDEVHDEEATALATAIARAHEALHEIDDLAIATDDQLAIEVGGTLLGLIEIVEDEAAARAAGRVVERSLAASLRAGVGGDGDDVFLAQVGAACACVEWDADPEGAWSRVEEG